MSYFWDSPGDLDHPDSALGFAFSFVHTVGDCAMLALYPPFLAAALNTSVTRPFANRRVQASLAAVAAALFVAVMMAALDWSRSSGTRLLPLKITLSTLYLALALVFWYALAASIHAWYRASGTARTRAGYFALAFGFRDICWSSNYIVALLELWSVMPAPPPNEVPNHFMVYTLGTLGAVPLIAYGILRTQLFDIDLRIRWTIKQSTIAAAVVVFFMAPLQRFAERVASAAMPNTVNTPEYAAHRKMQVYEAAVAEALQGGGVSQEGRDLQAGGPAHAPVVAS